MHEQNRYPHLLSQDAPALSAFLKEHGARYTRVDFDVRVGTGRDPGPDFDDNIRRDALDLSRRRIDALGTHPRGVDIIEVTSDAGTTALGQLLTYRALWMTEHKTDPPPRLLIVARALQTDMHHAFTDAGVEIHLYPDAD